MYAIQTSLKLGENTLYVTNSKILNIEVSMMFNRIIMQLESWTTEILYVTEHEKPVFVAHKIWPIFQILEVNNFLCKCTFQLKI